MSREVDELGYNPAEGEVITSVRSAIGKETGYMLRVQRFESLGFGFDDFLIHVRRIRSHALDDDRALETCRATEGAQEHLGLAARPDLVLDLVALGTLGIEGTSY